MLDYAQLAVVFQEVLLPYGLVGVFLLSFFNSSFSVIPTEILLVPLALLQPENVIVLAGVATLASVMGAGFAYYVGERGGRPVLERFVSSRYVERIEAYLQEHGYVIVGLSGISPLPFKVFCIASGVFDLELKKVLVVSLLFRGFRFFTIALLLAWYGSAIMTFIQQQFWLVTSAAAVVIGAGYWGWKQWLTV